MHKDTTLITQLERTLNGLKASPAPVYPTRNAIAEGLREARGAVAQAGQATAGAMVYLNLSDAMAASPAPRESRSYGTAVTARPAGEIMTFASEMFRASRVIQAGANLIQIAEAPAPVENDIGLAAWYKKETKFIVVKPASFGNVADGANVAASPLPIVSADFDLGESAAQAIHFKVSRDTQKAVTDDTLSFEIGRSLILGLAQLADKVLLDAIAATNPASYSLAAAAASGAHFHELRAIIGRSATGGVVNAAGDLTAAGLPAELTDQTAFTFAGIFNRSAIAVEREVRMVLKRTDLMGNLDVTCFVNLQAVLPSPSTFWKVAA